MLLFFYPIIALMVIRPLEFISGHNRLAEIILTAIKTQLVNRAIKRDIAKRNKGRK
jgi:hypothetical protein